MLKLQPDLAWVLLSKDARSFVTLHFCDLLIELKAGERHELRDFIFRTEASGWPWGTLLKQSELSRVVGLAAELYATKRAPEVSGLAQILMRAFPNSDEAQAVLFLEKRFERALQMTSVPARTRAAV